MPHQCTNCGRTFPDGSKEMLSGCPDCGGTKFQFEPSGGGGGAGGADKSTPSASSTAASSGADDTTSASETASTDETSTVSQAKQTVSDWVGRGSQTEADDAAASTADGDRSQSTQTDGSRSNIESTGNWPSVGSRDPSDDPTRSGDHPSRPTDTSGSPVDRASSATGASSSPVDSDPATTDDAELSPETSGEDTAQASARSDVVDPNDLPSDATGGAGRSDQQRNADHGSAPPDDADGTVVGTPNDEQPDLEALRKELNEQFESIKIVRPGEYELNLMELYDRDEYIISLMEDGRYAIEVPDAWRGGE
ncbi:hypothetical protein SAMN06269185_2298 [Natronoarchaeum philippinense]|uniref:Zn-ribbon containing protein n=1 Tax=Natronoarchaeum philippinense TaxID=558529 RepID=A0A285NZK1_NATPI|nr:Zn-ribbon containing protein [Natronoarchaeum philippinense]SNZ14890.1 hypothetical protein SAMN06269185_2298 [Natronoarchaeum philippinense]